MGYVHKSVLLNEVIEGLNIQSNKNYIDCTVSSGGHAEKILELNGPAGKLIGIDLDSQALNIAQSRLGDFGDRIILVNDNYTNIDSIIKDNNLSSVSGVVLDLGLSSYQLETSGKGFSFQVDEALDMRFGSVGDPAYTIINNYPCKKLEEIFRDYGEDPHSKNIAKNICLSRGDKDIQTTLQLIEIIEKSVPKSRLHKRRHVATQVFQALRIATNNEFENIFEVLGKVIDILEPGGRCAVITFHSLEDRIVKTFFKNESIDCVCPPTIPRCSCTKEPRVKLINKKVIIPTEVEVGGNPRSRSAKLRVIEKI